MAVAFSSANLYSATNATQLSFAVTNAGDAFCIFADYYYDTYGSDPGITVTCNGSTLTSNFSQSSGVYSAVTWKGYNKLSSSGTNNIVISSVGSVTLDYIDANVVCVSGAGALTSSNSLVGGIAQDNANHVYPISISSQANDLIVGFTNFNGSGLSLPIAMSGTYSSTPFWYNLTAGASPSVSITATYYGDSTDTADYFLAGYSFAPSAAPSVTTKSQVIGPQIGVWTNSRL